MWTLDAEHEEAIRTLPVLMRESGIEDDAVEFWRLWVNALRNIQPRLLACLSYYSSTLNRDEESAMGNRFYLFTL